MGQDVNVDSIKTMPFYDGTDKDGEFLREVGEWFIELANRTTCREQKSKIRHVGCDIIRICEKRRV